MGLSRVLISYLATVCKEIQKPLFGLISLLSVSLFLFCFVLFLFFFVFNIT